MQDATTTSAENQAWEKAHPIREADPNVWRTDDCGALINRDQYGTQTEFGWEIDQINPQANAGKNDITNARPLHWLNNRTRHGERLTCAAVWKRTHNVVTCKNCGNVWYADAETCTQCGSSA